MSYEKPDRKTITSSFQSSIAEALSTLSDPTTREKRQFVYMREPDVGADDFDGYPYVYLEDFSVSPEKATLNGSVFRIPAEFELVIDAEDEDADAKKHHDQIMDQLHNIITVSERTDFEEAGWVKPEIARNNRTTTVSQVGKPILQRTVTVEIKGVFLKL